MAPRGRPRSQPKAERRLKRELSDKSSFVTSLGYVRDIAVELIRACQTSPFISYVVGISTVEILHKLKIVGNFTTNLIVAILGLEIVGTAATELADLAGAIFGKSASVDHLSELGSKVTVNAPTQGSGATPNPTTSAVLGGLLSKVAEIPEIVA